MFHLLGNLKVVPGLIIEGAGAAATSLPISLKTVAGKLYVLINVYPAGGAAMALVPQTDALVAFGSAAVLTTAVPIWYISDTSTTDRWVEQTAAVNFSTDADANPKAVVFEIDPALLTAGEDCFRISVTNVPNADAVTVNYIFEPKYAAGVASVPTAITD